MAKTREEILELIEDRYFQKMLYDIEFYQQENAFERKQLAEKRNYISGMIHAYAYVAADDEEDFDNICEEQKKIAFTRFCRTSLATEENITRIQSSFGI